MDEVDLYRTKESSVLVNNFQMYDVLFTHTTLELLQK